ncbi:MAG: hypothetical protein IJH90_04540 [Mogibacterium sp.]|nr:hypothetical protein [Mogibacterium sp.]
MKFDYIVADPTGNITVLVTSPYTPDDRQEIIRAAFEREPDCEQVGFVMHDSEDPGKIHLEMMGYEFCGNAALSSAAWQAYLEGIGVGEEREIIIDSSGVDAPLSISVRRLDDHYSSDPSGQAQPAFEGTVKMPVPRIGSVMLADSGGTRSAYPIVHLDGISHIIVQSGALSQEAAESAIRHLAEEMGIPALGIMLCSEADEHSIHVRPLVYVRGSDTLVWESGCASGSTAVGWYLNRSYTDVIQPGGTIRITICDGHPYLTGKIVLRKTR